MKEFVANVADASGKESTLKLSVDERRQQGTLAWPPEVSNLIKMQVSKNKRQIICFIKWTTISVKCVISSEKVGEIAFLYVDVAGTRHAFTTSDEALAEFLRFASDLDLPVGSITDDDGCKPGLLGEDFVEDAETGLTAVSLFLAKQPAAEVEMAIRSVFVNGTSVGLPLPSPMPGNQGIFISLGLLATGNVATIAWEFETGYVRDSARVLVGIFRNGSLRDRTILADMNVNIFERYSGASGVKI